MGHAVDDRHGPAADDAVRSLAADVLAAYRIDPAVVQSMTVDLTAYGVPVVCVRLLLTPAALTALRSTP